MKPKHYEGAIDVIDLAKAQLTPEMVYGALVFNAMKYPARAHKKNGREDIAKARDYLDILLAFLDETGIDPREFAWQKTRLVTYSADLTDAEKDELLDLFRRGGRDRAQSFVTFTRGNDDRDPRDLCDDDALRDALARNAEPEEASGS